MRGSRLDDEDVASGHRHEVHQGADVTLRVDRFSDVVGRHAIPKPKIETRAWFGIDDVPRLGFSTFIGSERRVGIVGVDLHRKIVRGVEDLDEERGRPERTLRTEQSDRVRAEDLVEDRSVDESTREVRFDRQFPRLSDDLWVGQP
jgi:hypothetical protein